MNEAMKKAVATIKTDEHDDDTDNDSDCRMKQIKLKRKNETQWKDDQLIYRPN